MGRAYLDAAVDGGHHGAAEGDEGPAVFSGEVHTWLRGCEVRLGMRLQISEGLGRFRHQK